MQEQVKGDAIHTITWYKHNFKSFHAFIDNMLNF